MHSSCNVIKGSVVSGLEVIITPALDIQEVSLISDEAAEHNNDQYIDKSTIYHEMQHAKQETMKKAEEEAASIINSAKSKAQELLKSCKEEGYQQGYKEGYKQGYSYGIDESEKEGKKIQDEARKYLSDCKEAVKTYIEDKEKSIIDLSIEIARHIINTELTMNPDAICKMAHLAISKVADKQQVVLKVCPTDIPFIRDKKDELSIFTNNPSDIMIIPDASIKQGCVTAETSSGFADTDTENQLETLRKYLSGDS
jgi:flagellar assembly protein FliH